VPEVDRMGLRRRPEVQVGRNSTGDGSPTARRELRHDPGPMGVSDSEGWHLPDLSATERAVFDISEGGRRRTGEADEGFDGRASVFPLRTMDPK